MCVEELVDVSHHHLPGNWNDIWRLKVPPKVKNLLWRMCRGCLPTRVHLQDKGVSCPKNCASCDSDSKDLNHLLFECPFLSRFGTLLVFGVMFNRLLFI